VFISNKKMMELNSEFRKINEPTDVLSFNIDDENNEVYVSPSYIYSNYRKEKFEEEIVRMIVHGILHIYGFDHKGKFVELGKDSEDMFKEQERIIDNIMNK
jgi:probable rRNA maturation factor